MHDDLIASDHRKLTAPQMHVLRAVLDTIVPASDDGRMPSAAEFDFVAYLRSQAPAFLNALPDLVDAFDDGFADAPIARRVDAMRAFSAAHAETFQALLFRVYDCYYQNPTVQEAIGMGVGPPFPRGNTVESGDLTLLDPVVKLGRTWRR